MKQKEVEQRQPDTSSPPPVAPDSRPPEQLESTTRHIFLVKDGEYRCTRCGAEMNDRALDEDCPGGS
ncbi:MAG: hypothetical protein LC796_12100 [Acidobacteria bacterium]|nr:hypothetical protein [Acidobacteriota bacterium]MCA1610863.1 hypothetical protein [Acidobacteriota bacterium]